MTAAGLRPVRVVLDTNVLISAALSPGGTSRRTVDTSFATCSVLLLEATFAELVDVIDRPHLRRYYSEARKTGFLTQLKATAHWLKPAGLIEAGRDPKDFKFLDLAVSGGADYLVSGDQDLLVLHPFEGIPILTPAQFLAEMGRATT